MSNSRCLRPELRWANERMSTHRQVTIIGTGPAGLTAALYAGRANLEPLVIEGIETGGQLMLTTAVENYPGFRDGIMGPDLMKEMRLQADRFGATFVEGDVSSLDLSRRPFRITVGTNNYKKEIHVRHDHSGDGCVCKVARSRGRQAAFGSWRLHCATCDGFFFKGRDVAIVGGGDTAMEEAIYLAKLASTVTVIHRRDTLRASKVMQDKARSMPSIKWIWNTEVIDIKDVSKGEVTSLVLRDVHTRRSASWQWRASSSPSATSRTPNWWLDR